jgi:hypothetical protein
MQIGSRKFSDTYPTGRKLSENRRSQPLIYDISIGMGKESGVPRIGFEKHTQVALLTCACAEAAFADGTDSLDSFVGALKNGLNLIMVFGFIAGCVMVMSGFLNAKRDVFILTMLLNGDNGTPLLANTSCARWGLKFLLALLPTALTIAYVMGLRSRRPPRFDLDLLASWVNGRSFRRAHIQPRHPFIPHR